ncbi:Aconitase/3-isopropylmalate dehydratase large subunit alpha/beta/alpha subdomain 1/3 [Penicillium argentinense]|uniref:Aconitase/3-isopropylmalate dehydratase large subunit alpha/beta/alpha subdomain 1/3 n=1 Tax=Penicillium argentinense TaxID=1131581 RepID=A0A9W9EJL7_9EURO|nr:Aconitase/3-isopropylmalate dehydratase large subunit alpha/beta/alpha subdomain 1/3 [Penicillium argentinense]KAJ5083002.1 Aconitase/3-isopropylmalate dehydratase large subunit alpha/beta/alpha subdomain 1/3 [Penicillium argentinense]
MTSIRARELIAGNAEGDVLASSVALSFWGGVDPETGIVIDSHHPLVGQSVAGKVLAIPSGRGSCTGSGVILQLLLNDCAPCALIFGRQEMILTIGVLVAQEIFGKSIPVLQVPMYSLTTIQNTEHVQISNGEIYRRTISHAEPNISPLSLPQPDYSSIRMSSFDRELLDGLHGKAAQLAMRVILRTALFQEASTGSEIEMIDISNAHVDCCIYTGPATLEFAQRLKDLGGKFRIPTSLNSISIDQRLWRSQGVDPALGEPSEELAQAYVEMGARPTFTCAPYLLESAPQLGENIMWAESNAVVFANSVLGARTIKCPDYLDVCVALTGRSFKAGSLISENRKAQVEIHFECPEETDDTLFPLLGYLTGDIAADCIPIITGLERRHVTIEDLKAFGAAFATTSSAPMFHVSGITIEARTPGELEAHLKRTSKVTVTRSDLAKQWLRFNSYEESSQAQIDLVSLGNPHFSYDEMARLVKLCSGRKKAEETTFVVTCSREIYSRAAKDGFITQLEDFGALIVTDTCWCMIQEPVIPPHSRTILTNSAKYAHYGKGLTGRQVRFGGLAQCVDATCSGKVQNSLPKWLVDASAETLKA